MAVTVRLPAVFSVMLNVPEPFVNVELAGRIAAGIGAGEVNRARIARHRIVIAVLGRHCESGSGCLR